MKLERVKNTQNGNRAKQSIVLIFGIHSFILAVDRLTHRSVSVRIKYEKGGQSYPSVGAWSIFLLVVLHQLVD